MARRICQQIGTNRIESDSTTRGSAKRSHDRQHLTCDRQKEPSMKAPHMSPEVFREEQHVS